ncbi:MAG: GntR family transcriptional regulator [Clostridia bacterium]|nr:GntR family transcriptional regulator [Clostridia bacterium]
MNIFIDYRSRVPIYEQIKKEIILAVSRGELKPEEQLPSLRALSAELSVNINTIKRSFSELEDEGIIYSVAGKGSFISDRAELDSYVEASLRSFSEAVKNAKKLGVDKEELATIIFNIYGDGSDKND